VAASRLRAPTMPELMSAAEIADELGVSRQRVHKCGRWRRFVAASGAAWWCGLGCGRGAKVRRELEAEARQAIR